jgi:hypothetical protein
MKKLSIILTMSLLSVASFAQKAEDFYFPVDKYDFGALTEGDPASHTFEFTNKGNHVVAPRQIGQKHRSYRVKMVL